MRVVLVVLISLLFVPEIAWACQFDHPVVGWINTEGFTAVRLGTKDAVGPFTTGSLVVQSRGNHLIPIPPGDTTANPEPFQFLLANNENLIALFNLGQSFSSNEPELLMAAGYDLQSALGNGVNPRDDLSVQLGCNGTIGPIGDGSFTTIPGDVDFDLRVTFGDFLTLSENFGTTDASWPDGDFNWDREVQFSDFLMLSANFGESAPNAAVVPEPNDLVTVWLGLFGIAAFRRRQRR